MQQYELCDMHFLIRHQNYVRSTDTSVHVLPHNENSIKNLFTPFDIYNIGKKVRFPKNHVNIRFARRR